MDLSASSSDDEGANLYINAAYKLNALNSRTADATADDSEEEMKLDEEVKNDEMLHVLNSMVSQKVAEEKRAAEKKKTAKVKKTEEETVTTTVASDEDVINCIDDDDDDDVEIDSRPNAKSGRSTENSNKRTSAIPPNLEPTISINDSIERELNDTYSDSFDLSQDENDSYVVIGSPPPAKKSTTDDYEVSVKVLWKSNKVVRFEIKRMETFQKVFRYFANLEGVPEDQILITKKEKRITPFDTPISIDWSIIDILDGGVVSAEIVKKNKTNSKSEVLENACKIKIQLLDKRTLTMSLKNDEPFTSLLKKCSTELGIPEAKIKLYFDGDLIDEEETPESLDIDGEACIDLKVLK